MYRNRRKKRKIFGFFAKKFSKTLDGLHILWYNELKYFKLYRKRGKRYTMPNEKYGYNEYAGLTGGKLRSELSRLKRKIANELVDYRKTAERLAVAAEKLRVAEDAAEARPNKAKLAKRADNLALVCEPIKDDFRTQADVLEEDLLSLTKLFKAMENADGYTKGSVSAQKAATQNNYDYEKAAIEESVAYICPITVDEPEEEEQPTDEIGALAGELRNLRAAISDLRGQMNTPAAAPSGASASDRAALTEEVAKVKTEFEGLLSVYAIKIQNLKKAYLLAGKALASAEKKPRKKKLANRALEMNSEREICEEDVLVRSDELNKHILITEMLYSNLILISDAVKKAELSKEKQAVSHEMREAKRRAEIAIAPYIADEVLSLPADAAKAQDNAPATNDTTNNEPPVSALTEEELMEKALVDELKNGQNEVMRTLTTLLLEMRHTPAPAPAPVAEPQRPLRIAPVTVDVSKAVDKAVDAAMDKFRAVFDRKIEEYMTNVASPVFANMAAHVNSVAQAEPVIVDVTSTVEAAIDKMNASIDEKMATLQAKLSEVAPATKPIDTEAFDHAYQLSNKISDDERFLIEKLTTMLESIKALNDEMMQMTESYFAISEKQKEIAELQQQTNDLQRYTMREQEGVQVNQKVISTDQVTVIEAQTLIGEQQKTINEQQQAMVDSQKVMLVEQKMVIDAQATMDEAMKAVAEEQQALINGQQEILKSNARNIDMQNEIAAIQTEITASQKEAHAAQKQVAREQKAVNDKQAAVAQANAEILDSARTMAKEHKSMAEMIARLVKKTAKKAEPKAETVAEEAPVAEEPVVEAPVAETPVVEAPATEAPVAETPVVEAPAAEAPAAEVEA